MKKLRYYNAGPAGRNNSNLLVEKSEFVGAMLSLTTRANAPAAASVNIWLNAEQVASLRAQCDEFLAAYPAPVLPVLIEEVRR